MAVSEAISMSFTSKRSRVVDGLGGVVGTGLEPYEVVTGVLNRRKCHPEVSATSTECKEEF
jgi:hypothetical protein